VGPVDLLIHYFQLKYKLLKTGHVLTHVGNLFCHHGKTRHRVADGGDGLQIWNVAVNTLNESRTAKKKWSSRLGV
jgi:hypothetical protein